MAKELVIMSVATPLFLYSCNLLFKDSAPLSFNLCNITNELGTDVVFDGVTYKAHNVSSTGLKESINSSSPVTVKLGNLNNILSSITERQHLFCGGQLNIKQTYLEYADQDNFRNPPDTAGKKATLFEGNYFITQIKDTNHKEVSLEAGTIRDQQILIPAKVFSHTCSHTFKDLFCAYSGDQLTCDKTLACCRRLGNETKFCGVMTDRSKYV